MLGFLKPNLPALVKATIRAAEQGDDALLTKTIEATRTLAKSGRLHRSHVQPLVDGVRAIHKQLTTCLHDCFERHGRSVFVHSDVERRILIEGFSDTSVVRELDTIMNWWTPLGGTSVSASQTRISVCLKAIQHLIGAIQSVATESPEVLVSWLSAEMDPYLQRAVCQLMSRIGDASFRTPLLNVAFDNSGKEFVRAEAVAALNSIETPPPADIRKLLADKDGVFDSWLGEWAVAHPASIEPDTIVALLRDSDQDVRVGAALLCGRLKLRQAIDTLFILADDDVTTNRPLPPDRWYGGPVWRAALYAIGQTGDRSVVERLVKMLQPAAADRAEKASHIAGALAMLEAREAVGPLTTMLGEWLTWQDKYTYVSHAGKIFNHLGKIGDPAFLGTLREYLDHLKSDQWNKYRFDDFLENVIEGLQSVDSPSIAALRKSVEAMLRKRRGYS